MILSATQQVLAAQLKIKDDPSEKFRLCFTNSKTAAIAHTFAQSNLLRIDEVGKQVVVTEPAFGDTLQQNGIVDESGEVSELGQKLAAQQVVESYPTLIKVMKYVAS